MHRLLWALAACWCNNRQNLVCQPNYAHKPPTVIMVVKVIPQNACTATKWEKSEASTSLIYCVGQQKEELKQPARRTQAASKKCSSSQQEGLKQPARSIIQSARRTQAANKKSSSSQLKFSSSQQETLKLLARKTQTTSNKSSSSLQEALKQPARTCGLLEGLKWPARRAQAASKKHLSSQQEGQVAC